MKSTKSNPLLRYASFITLGTCILAGTAVGDPVEAFDGLILDANENSYLWSWQDSSIPPRDNMEIVANNGGILLHSSKTASSATSQDGGILLWGNPVKILLEGEGVNAHAASFEVSRGNSWFAFAATPIFKIDALTLATTFNGSNVTINGGSLSVGAGLTVTGNQTVSGTLSAGGSPVITSASAASVLTGQNFVQLGSGGVLNIGSTSGTAITVAGGISVAKDSSINGLAVGRGGGNISGNTALGSASLAGNSTGGSNTSVGNNALTGNTTGSNNTAVGANAGRYQADGSSALTTAGSSVYLGAGSRGYSNSDSNSIVIGASAVGAGANTTVIGTSATLATHLRGETNSDSLRVHGDAVVEGQIEVEGYTILKDEAVVQGTIYFEGQIEVSQPQGDISMGIFQ